MADNITALVKEMYELKSEKEQIEDRLKAINARYDEISKHKLPQIMEDTEQEKIKVTGIGTVYLQPDMQVSIYAKDQKATIQWFKDNGHESIVKETVHPGTLKSWSKEQIENGGSIPDTLHVHQFQKAILRRT